jgi:plastocyanin
MSRRLSRWCCIWMALLALGGNVSIHAATYFVGAKRIGTFPNQFFYWNPTNLVITVGDTVMWTNLLEIHSVNPAPSSTDPFCGQGTNEVSSCTVTFQNPGLFLYDCYQHLPTMTGSVRVLAPPVVTITNLGANSILSSPANVLIQAQATDVDGSVTNVQFLNNGVVFANSTTAPHTATLSNVSAGHYQLRARAVDNSALVTTSAPVLVRVAPQPTLVPAPGANGPLQFSFNTVTGIDYVVESSATLTNFVPVKTNAGSGGAQQFAQTNALPPQNAFRLRLQ